MMNKSEASIAIWKISGCAQPPNEGQDPRKDQMLESLALQASSLDDAARQLPGGAYTTFRTFERVRVLHLGDHFVRLEETARLAGQPLTLDRARIQAALRLAIANFPAGEMRVRITVDLEKEVGALYLALEKLHIPSEAEYINGVKVVTYPLQRFNPKAKLTSFIETAERVRKTLPPGVNEAVMIGDEGRLLEGLSSNFFAVLDGVIWTAEQGVLSGITRSMVLDAVRQLNIPLRLEGLPAQNLPLISEAFITSASRAVLPVTVIDGSPVEGGQPGGFTQRLLARYRETIGQALETL